MRYKSTKERAIELMNEINSQDNLMTASPFYYVVQVNKAHYVRDENDAEAESTVVWRREEEWLDIEEVRECYAAVFDLDDDEVEDYDAKHWADNEGYEKFFMYYKYVDYKDTGNFLTRKSCQRFIDSNNHHVGVESRPYIRHFWRNPDMWLVHEILAEYSGIPWGKH